ncbi:hypothetical protein V6N12_024033 [Hibiscus sabdariffa]|uniref:Uncharacterized protein n=1 Tax=Hibiscus sabdariffa TaxID=183260 RepID=A0ABR2FZF8_9ROSI
MLMGGFDPNTAFAITITPGFLAAQTSKSNRIGLSNILLNVNQSNEENEKGFRYETIMVLNVTNPTYSTPSRTTRILVAQG